MCGVLQGSILGPLFFLISINNLPTCDLASTHRLYADATRLTVTSCDPFDLQSKLNKDLSIIQSWFQANKLSLNVKKTKYSLIANQYKLAHLVHQLDIKIYEHQIDRVKSHRSLGIKIDNTLAWHSLIDHIVKKVSGSLAVLKQTKALVCHVIP